MSPLLFSVSGLRGIVGEDITPEIVIKYSRAFAMANGGVKYIVGQDTRPHSTMLKYSVIASLLASGKSVIDIGVVPTPTLLFFVREKHADGGIMITASHNPIEWNALKFVKKGGVFITGKDIERIKGCLDGYLSIRWNEIKTVHQNIQAVKDHIDRILAHPFINVDEIRRKRFKVACDCVNGAAYRAIPELLRRLNCEVIELNCEPSGIFPHNPEPRKENLKELDKILQDGQADIGFATDPDGDRLVIGLKSTGILSEEYTVPLASYYVLKKKKGPIVVNLSTSMLIEKIASMFKVKVHRTPVGEANVVEKMVQIGALIGGEGNGGVIFSEINPTRDSLTGIALVLSLAAEENLEEIYSILPEYSLKKERLEFTGNLPLEKIKKEFKGAHYDERDGIYIRFRRKWIHIRKSNTEPILRIYAEAPEPKEVEELIQKAREIILPN